MTKPSPRPPTGATPRRISGEDVIHWIRRPGIKSFRYRPNVVGFWAIVLFGALSLLASYLMIRWSSLAAISDKVSFVIAVSIGLYAIVSAIVGVRFSIRSYIAMSPDELMVGEGPDAWVLPLSRLNRETLRFDRMDAKRYSSSIPLEMDELSLSIHIAGVFSVLRSPQGFMAELLEVVLNNEEQAEQQATVDG